MMSDVAIAWTIGLAIAVGLLALMAVAAVQAFRRYRGRTVPQTVWVTAIVLYPLAGLIAWALWDNWGRDLIARRAGSSAPFAARAPFGSLPR